MTEKLINCPRCSSNACSEISNEKLIVWNCFGCGFTTNSTMTEGNIEQAEIFLTRAEIAKQQKNQWKRTVIERFERLRKVK